jgi:hypothetical protein
MANAKLTYNIMLRGIKLNWERIGREVEEKPLFSFHAKNKI